MAAVKALVGKQPCVDVFYHGADDAETGTMLRSGLADVGLNACTEARAPIAGAVIPGISA